MPNNLFGSTLGGNKTAGLSGHSAVVQFANVAAWLADNGYASLNLTVYYSSYATLNGNTTDAAPTFVSSYANIYLGDLDASNVGSFTSTAGLAGTASIATQGTGPYYAASTISGITGNFVVAELLNNASFRGGIAALKIEGVSAVPEPSAYGLLGAGALAGLTAARRRRRAA